MNEKRREEIDRANQHVQRAQNANMIIDNPLYKDAIAKIQADLINSFRSTDCMDKELREELHRQMKTVMWFENHFEKVLKTGKAAQEKLSLWQQLTKNKNNLEGL
tara:strand:+ start:650 stop:964 length:315 start_codon:yes stop_codon:yes gene_type:complete